MFFQAVLMRIAAREDVCAAALVRSVNVQHGSGHSFALSGLSVCIGFEFSVVAFCLLEKLRGRGQRLFAGLKVLRCRHLGETVKRELACIKVHISFNLLKLIRRKWTYID